jgi:hypothetical protein
LTSNKLDKNEAGTTLSFYTHTAGTQSQTLLTDITLAESQITDLTDDLD